MELRIELGEELVEELQNEAGMQRFEDLEAYLEWIIAHRPMSDLATTQAPAVASRVSELEDRLTLIERHLDLDRERSTDLGASESASGVDLGVDETGGNESTTEEVDITKQSEDAAADDDIAEAIGDVALDDDP